MKLLWKLGLFVGWLSGLASMAWAQAPLLAPGGSLRAVINVGNPILAQKDVAGRVTGVSVELAQALAQRLKVPLVLKTVTSARQAVEAVTGDEADVGFFAIDPLRAQGIAFTTPYLLIEGSYLVRNDSPLQDNDEVDRSSHRVVVGQGSAYDLFLTRHLQKAQLIRSATSPAVVDDFLRQGGTVAAALQRHAIEGATVAPAGPMR